MECVYKCDFMCYNTSTEQVIYERKIIMNFKNYIRRFAAAVCAAVCAVSAIPAVSSSAAETKYEAENAVLSGMSVSSGSSYSGGKYVTMRQSGSCTFTIEVEKSGMYDFNFVSSGVGSDKTNNAALDGESIGTFTSVKDKLGDAKIYSVYVEKGSHKVKVTPSWGWINLDCLIVTEYSSDKDYYNVSKELINPDASENAQRLMSFLADNYGVNVISGQQCDGGINGNEFKAIKNQTGKTPAMLGMDLMRYTPTRVSKGDTCKTVENAIEFWNNGGIVTLCWHWNAPDKYLKSGTDENGNPRWWGGFYTSNLNMDFSAIMDGKDKEGYDLLMADIDAIAVQLKKLKQADVPVLFRPLHEASGGWFWWGSDGSEPYKKLWRLMYDKLTNEYGLDNLIWVWNGQSKDWYPGDEYVDIIGEDIYPGSRVYNPQSSKFVEAANYTDISKIVTLSENGCLFDVDKALSAGTVWSWFCVWAGDFCSYGTSISESYTEKSMWNKVYNHENVITLDEMPDIKTYPYPAENAKGSISGTISIKDTEGVSPAQVTVTVTKEGAAAPVYRETVNKGNYKVPDLAAGKYTVTFSADKCVSRSYSVTVGADGAVLNGELYLLGDVNGDGRITTADAGLANSHVRNIRKISDSYKFKCADINGNGTITTSDVGRINAHVRNTKKLW